MAAVAVASDEQADRAAARALRRTHVVEVVERVRDSVVNISSTRRGRIPVRPSSIFRPFDIYDYPQKTSGSGFVIHQDGYIVTNEHVVAQSADHRVRFADGREYEAIVVARDHANDLAVLRIEPDEKLSPLRLGRSDDVMLGEDAIAIGNPFGLENTITRGVISATNRKLTFDRNVVIDGLLQTDASINPGNSGGPLLNAAGELIGINTAIRPDAENVGFAIPVDRLREVLPDMLDIGKLRQVAFGIRVAGESAKVVEVKDGSPAAKAGVRLGDVVWDVDDERVRRAVDFSIAMLGRKAGDTVKLTLDREGVKERVSVVLEEMPKLDGAELAWAKLGMRLMPLSRSAAARFGLRRNAGLVISEVDPRGPAGRSGIQKGDLLGFLGRYGAWPMEKVANLLERVERDEVVDVRVFRFYTDGSAERLDERLYAR